MNKEKEVKELLNKCDNCKLKECIGCEFTCTEIQKIKEYVEQKETILDKVTDKLKETIKKERELMPYLPHKSASFHYANGREVLAKEILEFIEGEKK